MISLPDRAEQSDSNIASNNYDVPAHADDKSPEFRIAVRAHFDKLKSKFKRLPCSVYARPTQIVLSQKAANSKNGV